MKAETLFRINLFCLLEEHTDIGTTFYRECRVYYYNLSTIGIFMAPSFTHSVSSPDSNRKNFFSFTQFEVTAILLPPPNL